MRKTAAKRKAPARKVAPAAPKVATPPTAPAAAVPKVKIAKAKGRPMLAWVGKRPLRELVAFPAQEVERFAAEGGLTADIDWSEWPERYPRGGLLFHGDNKEVLAHLLANGFRSKVDLIYIDPPFDSGADYVRRVQLRGVGGNAKLDGEGYTIGEQLQYTDIWANDNYLQFMYERVQLLKELLREGGALFLHCDYRRAHQLRSLVDEIFGTGAFLNEIVWSYRRWPSDTDAYQAMHDTILYYVLPGGEPHTFHRSYEEASESYMRRFGGKTQRLDEATRTRKITSDEATRGMPMRDVWDLSIVAGFKAERTDYPTQKPETLLERIIAGSSNPGDIILDCFIGSGTTAAVAQTLGRRWIGCDVNKGAIQTTTTRLIEVISEQARQKAQQLSHEPDHEASRPAQLVFTTYRVNDYDLAIQHAEAVALAAETLGIVRTSTDAFFDGTVGKKLVKIIPFDHPASPIDLEQIAIEIRSRPREDRDIVAVCLGKELACDPWLAEHNRRGAPNKIQLIELRSDPKYGGLFAHTPASADVNVTRKGRSVTIEIEDFLSPTIVERLKAQEGIVAPKITDWRQMVDSVMVDPAHDGKVFNVVIADVPENKDDVVAGTYELEAPARTTTIAVKITDMLGEELLITRSV